MNGVDAIIIMLVVANAVIGRVMGLVWQIAGLLTLIAGTVAGWLLSIPLALVLSPMFTNPYAPRVLGFFLIFGAVSLFVRLLAALARVYVKRWELEPYDQKLGVVFGIINALVLSMLVCTGWVLSNPEETTVRESLTGRLLVGLGAQVISEPARAQIRTWAEQRQDAAGRALDPTDQRRAPAPDAPSARPPSSANDRPQVP